MQPARPSITYKNLFQPLWPKSPFILLPHRSPVQTARLEEMVLEAMAVSIRGIIHQHEGSQSALGSDCCHKGVMAARQLGQQRHTCLLTIRIHCTSGFWSLFSQKHLKIKSTGKCRCKTQASFSKLPSITWNLISKRFDPVVLKRLLSCRTSLRHKCCDSRQT